MALKKLQISQYYNIYSHAFELQKLCPTKLYLPTNTTNRKIETCQTIFYQFVDKWGQCIYSINLFVILYLYWYLCIDKVFYRLYKSFDTSLKPSLWFYNKLHYLRRIKKISQIYLYITLFWKLWRWYVRMWALWICHELTSIP